MRSFKIIQTPTQKYGLWLVCAVITVGSFATYPSKAQAIRHSFFFAVGLLGLSKILTLYWIRMLKAWAENASYELLEIQFIPNTNSSFQVFHVRVKDKGKERTAILHCGSGILWFHGNVDRVQWDDDGPPPLSPSKNPYSAAPKAGEARKRSAGNKWGRFLFLAAAYEYWGMKHWPEKTLSSHLGEFTFLLLAALLLGYAIRAFLSGKVSMDEWGTVYSDERPVAFITVLGIWTVLGLVCLLAFFTAKHGTRIPVTQGVKQETRSPASP